jgi:glucose-6-phosphate dehydrogenase assembly protein OpcA
MIVELPNTSTDKIDSKLTELRQRGNAGALGRVLTLVILNDEANPTIESHAERPDAEPAIEAANEASREHPSRVLVLTGAESETARLDAQIRVGGDAGVSEVLVLQLCGPLRGEVESVITPLLVADAPVVAWWPHHAPDAPGDNPIGQIASLRITDSNHAPDGLEVLHRLAKNYRPGDTDLAWTRLTSWRAQIAAALDLPPDEPITSVDVYGQADNAAVLLLAAWLAEQLGCPVTSHGEPDFIGIRKVELTRPSGAVVFDRPDGHTLTISQLGFPDRKIDLPRTTLSEALIEELRRLDADPIYFKALTVGLDLVTIN